MPIVVDTSVAIKWVVAEQYSVEARLLRNVSILQNEPILVPSLLMNEAANVLYDMVRYRGLFGWADAEQALDDIAQVVTIVSRAATDTNLLKATMRLAGTAGKKDTFDSHFLALAQARSCTLWTAGRRFAKRWLNDRLPSGGAVVRLIETYPWQSRKGT